MSTRTPAKAVTVPTQTIRGARTPSSRISTIVHSGVVVTSAVAEATEVIRRLGIQSPKWTASSTPAAIASSSARRGTARSSARWRSSA